MLGLSEMSDHNGQGDSGPNMLSNRDTIILQDELSLSDSDPEDALAAFGQRVEDLTSSDEDEGRTCKDHQQGAPLAQPCGPDSSVFQLRGGSSSFSSRSRNIFESLESVTRSSSGQLADDNVLSGTFARPAPPSPPPMVGQGCQKVTSRGSQKPQWRQRQEQQVTVKGGSRVPDYLAHPERWTRYSLDDVPETSDRQNSQVALQFLQDLQNRHRSAEVGPDLPEPFLPTFNQSQCSADHHKILFKPRHQQSARERGESGGQRPHHKKVGVGLQHLGESQDEEADGCIGGSTSPKGHMKRKWVPNKESEEEEDKEEPISVAFNTSKKANRKHFRKTSLAEQHLDGEEDN